MGVRSLGVFACVLALAFSGHWVYAADTSKYWQPTAGTWSVDANWDPYGTPTSRDYAYIDNDKTATIASSVETRRTRLGFSGTGTVIQTGGTHYVDEGLSLRWPGGTYELRGGQLSGSGTTLDRGTFTQSGGTHSVRYLSLGDQTSSTGTYELQDGQLSVEWEYVGRYGGVSSFVQSGGPHSEEYLALCRT